MSKFLNHDEGATAIEYGILSALMGAILVGIVQLWGDGLENGFAQLGSGFASLSLF